MGQVLGQIILLISYNILHIGTMIIKYICVAIGFGFHISLFWHKYECQTRFRITLVAYWVVIFLYKVLYGCITDIRR